MTILKFIKNVLEAIVLVRDLFEIIKKISDKWNHDKINK